MCSYLQEEEGLLQLEEDGVGAAGRAGRRSYCTSAWEEELLHIGLGEELLQKATFYEIHGKSSEGRPMVNFVDFASSSGLSGEQVGAVHHARYLTAFSIVRLRHYNTTGPVCFSTAGAYGRDISRMATTTRGGGTSPAMSMKLLVDTKAGCVLFAEAGKDVVDFLLSLLALPVGTAVSLLGKRSMVGSAGHLYASVQRLDDAYVLPGADIDALLRPAVPSPAAASNVSLLCLPGPSSSAASKRFFWCGEDHSRSYAYGHGCGPGN
ncbi:hypothetical protein D1007_13817 [Hordeum vulgare]|nr:hypothetical protein D1007_13817 [Hordeum vulgare]